MGTTGLNWSEDYYQHDTGPHHPERPARLTGIHDRLDRAGWFSRTTAIAPLSADVKWIERVHDADYIRRIEQRCQNGLGYVDSMECPLSPETFEVAKLAVGGVLAACNAVMNGAVRNAFCAVRPPGHHAERSKALGFCYFNNIAIAAEYLRDQFNLQRVAILDWDVHHGNGTQHHFEADPGVLFLSVHQHPRTLFPGTGYDIETGTGEGENTTLNVPMMPGSGDPHYRQAFEQQILPKLAAFRPEFLLISSGFDAHADDPLANIELSTEMFEWMTCQAVQLADAYCQGRIVSILEGGYNLDALAESVMAHLEGLSRSD